MGGCAGGVRNREGATTSEATILSLRGTISKLYLYDLHDLTSGSHLDTISKTPTSLTLNLLSDHTTKSKSSAGGRNVCGYTFICLPAIVDAI